MKINSGLPDDELPRDALSVYLALEKRVKDLENELSFTKLLINTVYIKVKEIKQTQEFSSESALDSSEQKPGDRIIDYLRTNLTPRLDELIEQHEQLLRDYGGLGKAD